MKLVPSAVTLKVAEKVLLVQKNSPGVLFGAGVVGMVGSTVLACRATLKMDAVLEEARTKRELATTLENVKYTEEDRQSDLKMIRVKTGVQIIKLYTPAIVVGGLSIAALTTSHKMLNQRVLGLTAAYAALEEAYRRYRERVVERYGEEVDHSLMFGSMMEHVGKGKKDEIVHHIDPDTAFGSVYAKFFDESNPNWQNDPEFNMYFIKCQQDYANNMLRARGYVFLNDVYDSLGIERTSAGAVVGWLLDKSGTTDNYVSFGLFEGNTQKVRDFVNGYEGSILLDFNVDGLIWDKIGTTTHRRHLGR